MNAPCIECTERMKAVCPNYSGNLVVRPVRSQVHLRQFSSPSVRVVSDDGYGEKNQF
ncbi:DUF1272 domain-containing protein [Endozoicomonas sp. OPT23]|uniref:DUF1272 domain-containing protein n=1 Tax=Endozoicomonas sp. OPT23 TaxID=2072845 RepID=UPI00351B786D